MNIIKEIVLLPIKFVKIIALGFSYICSVTTKGFYSVLTFIFSKISCLFHNKLKLFETLKKHFKKREGQPEFLLLLLVYLTALCSLYNIFYDRSEDVVKLDHYITSGDGDTSNVVDKSDNNDNNTGTANYQETNLFRRYGATSLENVNINNLKQDNPDTVLWLTVDGTNINYPIVQTTDNDYYLSHSYDKSSKKSGWTFLDYRNDNNLNDKNSIFYGHNLLNKTGFGSIANIFTKNWYKNSNKSIVILSSTNKFIYEVFSVYTIDPELYYLQTNFGSVSDYSTFLTTIKNRSIYKLSDVSTDDSIITLSTCTDDNKGRKVIHAKLVSKQ